MVELLQADYAHAIQPIEGMHFYCYRFRSRYQGLGDRAFSVAYYDYYLQVRANPPIRLAEWSGDKNLYYTANITTMRIVCSISHAPSLLEDKYVITRALVEIQKI